MKKRYKHLTISDKQMIANKMQQSSVAEVAEMTDVPKRTMFDWRLKLQQEGYMSEDSVGGLDLESPQFTDEAIKIHKLQEENKQLRGALKEAKSHVTLSSEIRDLILGVSEVTIEPAAVPDWVSKPSTSKNNIVPVLCISDVHMGEVIKPEEVNYVNAYDSSIAKTRVHQCVDDFIDIYKNKMTNYTYDGVVVIMPGDNITGNLHDLAEHNDTSAIDQIIQTVVLFQEVLLKLEKAFGNVVAFCVSGNHGRLQPKGYTKTKGRYNNSLEKIVYHFLEVNLKDNNVSIITNPSDVVRFTINGKRFRLEHGDTIKSSGTAIAGPITGWERARLKKSSIDSATNNSFDVLILGHFHHHSVSGSMVVCNSPKGWDEYCQMMSIPYGPPGCTSFSVNNHGQLIFVTDIQCREKKIIEHKKHIEVF